ncbi:MAG: EscU/YscU/HrcU family type III secretion system export apparatus switch protein [Alphaproteobacteria bacterium]|nr:EscU/YscU/HrcU family type III secretion system export apparatus switch protein [Alphaproteobacteria bacterium]
MTDRPAPPDPSRAPQAPKTDVAIALAYARDHDEAPRVVAKGQGELAQTIERLAEAHGVPVRRDASLASLLAAVEVDSFIPVEAYVAVAQILSYIYQRDPGPGASR